MSNPNAAQTTVTSAAPLPSVADVVGDAIAAWRQTYRRRVVTPSPAPDQVKYPIRLQNLPEWPGRGMIVDTASEIPVVTVEGMPAARYPEYAAAMVMYTSAAMCVERPELALARATANFQRTVTLAVLARCHAWAAIGRVPSGSENAPLGALRWSAKIRSLVVRPAQAPDQFALWRHFLATAPPALAGTQALNAVMYGLGPALFMYGANLLHGAGETYSLHLVEREMVAMLASKLDRATLKIVGLHDRQGLETMAAAATSGYRASVINHVAKDPLFVTQAQMLIYPDDTTALQRRLDALVAASGSTTFDDVARGGMMPQMAALPPKDDDMVSVADTEADALEAPERPEDIMNRYFNSMPGDTTPRPGTPTGPGPSKNDIDEIRRSAQKFQEESPLAPSAIMNAMDEDSVHF